MRTVTLLSCALFGAVMATACSKPTAVPAPSGVVAEDAAAPLPPLETAAPAIVPAVVRRDATSSTVVFDAFRGGVWVANGDVGSISYVNVATQTVIAEIPIGTDVRSVAVSPDGAWVAAVDRGGAQVALVNPNTFAVERTIAVGTHPRAAVWDAANPRWLYVALEDAAAVALIDRSLGVVNSTVAVGRLPSGVAVSAQRRELYVTHRVDALVSVLPLAALPDSEVDAGAAFTVTCTPDDAGADGGDGGDDASTCVTVPVDAAIPVDAYGPPFDGGPPVGEDAQVSALIPLHTEVAADGKATTPHGAPFAFESLAWGADGVTAWLPHELLANTHPFQFQTTLFPAVSVVDLEVKQEVMTDPNDPNGVIAGRKNLFDAINLLDETGNVSIMSQPCAAAFHPNGTTAYVVMCGSEDIVKFDLTQGIAVDIYRNIPGDHPTGIAIDPAGARAYVYSDQSLSLSTFDLKAGSLIDHVSLLAGPLSTVATDTDSPLLRQGQKLFYRANSQKGAYAIAGNNWMSCAGCHLDGFVSTNEVFFEVLSSPDITKDARIGHTGLSDFFTTIVTPDSPKDPPANPHDVIVAMEEMGGLTPDRKGLDTDAGVDPSNPPDAAVAMVNAIAQVVNRDLPIGPSWLLKGATPVNLEFTAEFCGQCHEAQYQLWQQSVHAHAGVDPMMDACKNKEQSLAGYQVGRLCAGCHDPVSTRAGDTSLTSGRGIICISCHDAKRLIQAGGNTDVEYFSNDWTKDHKASATATLDIIRKPEFCGVCHEQFVPATGMIGINTLREWQASPFSGLVDAGGDGGATSVKRCIDCHAPENDAGVADHRMIGGNYYMAMVVANEPAVAAAAQARVASGLSLSIGTAVRDAGADAGSIVPVVLSNTNIGHTFPTGVVDIREPWVELQAVASDGTVVAHYGGPEADGTLSLSDPGRLGADLADGQGNLLYEHELAVTVSIPFVRVVPAGGSITLDLPWPGALPAGATNLDAVLYFRSVRTQYIRLATGDAGATAPEVEIARVRVQ